jgi:hypothetical protein
MFPETTIFKVPPIPLGTFIACVDVPPTVTPEGTTTRLGTVDAQLSPNIVAKFA